MGDSSEARLPIACITMDPDLQPRHMIRESVVTEYLEDMRLGAQFPPVLVFRKGNRYWLADGWHRIEAAKKLGRAEILAEVRMGSRRDALLTSCSVNAIHGVRRTVIDKRRSVMTMLQDPEWSQWSSRQIAKWCHVSHTFVDNMRAELGQEPAMEREYVTRQGSRASMNTRKIGRTQRRSPAASGETLRARVQKLESMLKELEWSYDYYGEECCPVCKKRRFPDERHDPDCRLAVLLEGDKRHG